MENISDKCFLNLMGVYHARLSLEYQYADLSFVKKMITANPGITSNFNRIEATYKYSHVDNYTKYLNATIDQRSRLDKYYNLQREQSNQLENISRNIGNLE